MSHELADITYVSLEYCIKQANKLVAWFKLLDPYISWYEVLLHFHKYSTIGFGAYYRELRLHDYLWFLNKEQLLACVGQYSSFQVYYIEYSNYKQTACINVIVTLSAKTRIVRTSTHIEKKTRNLRIICEIMHATGKYLQGLIRPAISERSFKSTKTIHHLTFLAMENLKIFVSFLQPEH